MTADATAAGRIAAFSRALAAGRATRAEELRWGVAFFNDSLPDVWDLNFVAIDDGGPDVTTEAAAHEAHRVQGAAGLTHRKIEVADSGTGARLAPGFRRLGWSPGRLLEMKLERRLEYPRAVTEVAWDRFRPFVEDTVREGPHYRGDERLVAHLTERDELTASVVSARYFAVVADDRVVAGCQLYSDGSVAQIESVGTLQAFRRNGYGGAVVRAAANKARGHELVFLYADDDDWPKEMYRRLGFEPVALLYDFVLPNAGGTK